MRRTFFLLFLLPFSGSDQLTATLDGTVLCTRDNPSENVAVFLTGPHIPRPQPPQDPVVLDQRNLRFTPHVLPVVRGTTVAFPNSDQIPHNVFSASEARMFNLGTYAVGETRTVTFNQAGVVELLCNVHPEMSAYILVLDTPYFTPTDKRGAVRIQNIIPGTYSLQFWCEHRGVLSTNLHIGAGEHVRLRALLHADAVAVNGKTIAGTREESKP